MFDLLVGSNLDKGVKNLLSAFRQDHCSMLLQQEGCGKSRECRWDSSLAFRHLQSLTTDSQGRERGMFSWP